MKPEDVLKLVASVMDHERHAEVELDELCCIILPLQIETRIEAARLDNRHAQKTLAAIVELCEAQIIANEEKGGDS